MLSHVSCCPLEFMQILFVYDYCMYVCIIRTVVRIVGMGRMSHIYGMQNVHVYKLPVKIT